MPTAPTRYNRRIISSYFLRPLVWAAFVEKVHVGPDVEPFAFFATTNHVSTIVARGGVKRTVARTTTGEALKGTTFKAKLKPRAWDPIYL